METFFPSIVSSTSAGRRTVAVNALAALETGRLPFRQAERARVCRSIVSSRRIPNQRDYGWVRDGDVSRGGGGVEGVD